ICKDDHSASRSAGQSGGGPHTTEDGSHSNAPSELASLLLSLRVSLLLLWLAMSFVSMLLVPPLLLLLLLLLPPLLVARAVLASAALSTDDSALHAAFASASDATVAARLPLPPGAEEEEEEEEERTFTTLANSDRSAVSIDTVTRNRQTHTHGPQT